MNYLYSYPLARSAGVFLLLVGAAMLYGASAMRSRYQRLAVGALAAAVLTSAAAQTLAAPYGAPTGAQIRWLLAAVALEIGLLFAVMRYAPRQDDRTRTALILFVVGVHFIPMAPAFGPVLLALGFACVGNAFATMCTTRYSLRAMWIVDGALKALAGAALWFMPLLSL